MQENHEIKPLRNLRPARKERAVAVAIDAKEEKPESLPHIVASGRGDVANQILDLAFKNGVKVRQDQPLAEILVQLDLDTPIPSEAIIAVAEILAKVYEANSKAASLAALKS